MNGLFYETLLKAYPGAIVCEDANRKLLWLNNSFLEMFSIDAALSQLVGMDCKEAAEASKQLFIDPNYFIQRIDRILNEQVEVLGDLLYLKDGRCLERDYRPVFTGTEYSGHVWFYRDTTNMHNMSVIDPLTGLHNRRGFEIFTEQYLRVAKRSGEPVHVLFADLDGLKRVNDTQGHDAGDALIKAGAEVLRNSLRECDLVARLGGDEFVALIVGSVDVEHVMLRLRTRILRYNKEAHSSLSMSMGFATHSEHESIKETMDRADTLMYCQKKMRKKAVGPGIS